MSERGLYIALEGPDRVGKSTQAELLVNRMRDFGRRVINVREPGGTSVGDSIRGTLLNANLRRRPETNLLLFTASRLELWHQRIAPALARRVDIVTDRNWRSNAAYQGYAEGLGIARVHEVTAQFLPDEYMNPDLTFLLLASNGGNNDRMDTDSVSDTFESRGRPFMDTVVQGYLKTSEQFPGVTGIEAGVTVDEVHEQIWQEVQSHLRAQDPVERL